MIVQCCLCKKVRDGRRWVTADPITLDEENISHGYCPACAAQAFAEIRSLMGVKHLSQKVAVS